MKKTVVFSIVFIILAFGVFSGGQRETLKAKGIRFVTNETDPESLEADRYIIKSFEEKYPDVKVLPEYVTVENADQKLIAMISADINPDIYYAPTGTAAEFYEQGLLETLDDVQKAIGDDFDEKMLDIIRKDGKLFGIPTQTGSVLYFYRKDLAQNAGYVRPQTPDELLDMVAKMTTDKIYGTTLIAGDHANSQTIFCDALYNSGGYFFNKDGTKAAINTEYREASLKVLDFMLKLAKYAPPGFLGRGYAEAAMDFNNEAAASLHYSTRLPSKIVAQKPELLDKTAAIPLPAFPGGESVMLGSPSVWILFKNSKNIEASRNFIVHFMTGDRYAKFLRAVPLHLIPMRKSYVNNADYLADPIVGSFQDTLVMLMDNLGNMRDRWAERGKPMAGSQAVWRSKALAKNLSKLYAGKITPEECLDLTAKEWNRILSE